MTRFARAKGSKSSNERLPNDATPWDVMKQQLEESQAAKQFAKKKAKSAKQLLEEKEEAFYYDSTGNVNHEWATFDDVKAEEKAEKIKDAAKKKKTKSSKLENAAEEIHPTNLDAVEKASVEIAKDGKNRKRDHEEISGTAGETLRSVGKKEKKIETTRERSGDGEKNLDLQNSSERKAEKSKSSDKTADNLASRTTEGQTNGELNGESNLDQGTAKASKKKSRLKSKAAEDSVNERDSQSYEEDEKIKNDSPKEDKVKPRERLSKRQKRNQKKKSKSEDRTGESANKEESKATGFDVEGNDWSSQVKFGKGKKQAKRKNPPEAESQNEAAENRKMLKRKPGANDENNSQDPSHVEERNCEGKSVNNPNEQSNKRKAPKVRDNKVHKRRKPDPGAFKLTINGVEIEVVKYDGFPIKKEDAERLKELKKNMIIKGIPRSEINAAMKLERRKAEKALARERKHVCFHCRKSGHNLSDCPELGRDEAGSGICFKCGSAEHTHFQCRVNRGEEFRFASCFICREPGHIARQCPDNPKGLYPQGGACKICGDVTHLKKDCPDLIREKEEAVVTLGKIRDNAPESLEEDVLSGRTDGQTGKDKKNIVRF